METSTQALPVLDGTEVAATGKAVNLVLDKFRVFRLQTSNNQSVYLDRRHGNLLTTADPEAEVDPIDYYFFLMFHTQSGQTQQYLVKPWYEAPECWVNPTNQQVYAVDATSSEKRPTLFYLEERSGQPSLLKTENGEYLQIASSGAVVADKDCSKPDQLLLVCTEEDMKTELCEQQDCCGTNHQHSDPTHEVQWDEEGHYRLVKWARDILDTHATAIPSWSKLSKLLKGAFDRGIYAGLKDADALSLPYNGFFYSSHFYDPDTGNNWLGILSTANALSEAKHFFFNSSYLTHAYLNNIQLKVNIPDHVKARFGFPFPGEDSAHLERRLFEFYCGYTLGLALHFFTDLTQPMHTANFINIPGYDWRHSYFESTIDDILKQFKIDDANPFKVAPSEVDPEIFNPDSSLSILNRSIDDLVIETARASKKLYKQKVIPVLNDWSYTLVPSPFLNVMWRQYLSPSDPAFIERLKLIALPSIRQGQLATAAFLVRWSRAATTIVNFLEFVPDGVKEGDSGYWTLSAEGKDGTWRRSRYSASLKKLRSQALSIDGQFSSPWWGWGRTFNLSVQIEAKDIEKSLFEIAVADGDRESPYNQSFTFDAIAIFNNGDFVFTSTANNPKTGKPLAKITMRRLPQAANWYKGLQFWIDIDGLTRYACFEDASA